MRALDIGYEAVDYISYRLNSSSSFAFFTVESSHGLNKEGLVQLTILDATGTWGLSWKLKVGQHVKMCCV
jgi:hypothetical protein